MTEEQMKKAKPCEHDAAVEIAFIVDGVGNSADRARWCPTCGALKISDEPEWRIPAVSRIDARGAAAKHVASLLKQRRGSEVADFWAWEMTPMPCGLPSDEQLGAGLVLAFFSPPPDLTE